jgi:hypothetical protein
MRGFNVITAACLTAACYNYQPLATPTPEPGAYIVATLSDSGSQELARYLGPNVTVVRGRYLGDSERGLLVSVSSVEMERGHELAWAGETVALPIAAVSSLQVRRLAAGRSVLLVGAGVTGLVATTAAFVAGGGGATPPGGPGGGPSPK